MLETSRVLGSSRRASNFDLSRNGPTRAPKARQVNLDREIPASNKLPAGSAVNATPGPSTAPVVVYTRARSVPSVLLSYVDILMEKVLAAKILRLAEMATFAKIVHGAGHGSSLCAARPTATGTWSVCSPSWPQRYSCSRFLKDFGTSAPAIS